MGVSTNPRYTGLQTSADVETLQTNVAAIRSGKGHTFAQSGAASAHTGGTTEVTQATIAGLGSGPIGANGAIRISLTQTHTNGADDKTTRIKFGGTTVATVVATTGTGETIDVVVRNANGVSAQVTEVYVNGALVSQGTAAVNTSAATSVLITTQLENGADTVTVLGYTVELLKAPA